MSQPTGQDGTSPTPAPAAAALSPRKPRWRKWLIALAVAFVLSLVAAELFARFVLRLGDPPLYMADPEIEYLMVPSRTYKRFYATSTYNKWSMRNTPDIEKTKTDPKELRVLVIGDSVVNGGPQTDDKMLATALLVPKLQSTYQRPVVVGNISAGSWGPPNMLAYSRRFGFFSADVLVIVLNHEDAIDVPTFDPLGPEQPTRTPTFALEEAFFRYIPAWLGTLNAKPAPPLSPDKIFELEDKSIGALKQLVASARAANVKVIGVLHASRSEANGEAKPGTAHLRAALTDLGVLVRDDAELFRATSKAGNWVYRDEIHPMPEGQVIIADVIYETISEALPR